MVFMRMYVSARNHWIKRIGYLKPRAIASRSRWGACTKKPVGPHPCWSCQLAFPPEKLGDVTPWLALNREGQRSLSILKQGVI
jgi:aromatic ring-cleaving dioxygenase